MNRSLVVVRPRAPFLDWLNDHPDTDWAVRIEEFEHRAYLVPEADTAEGALAWVDRNARALFEAELATWYRDRATRPADRGAAAFHLWFEAVPYGQVEDAAPAWRLRREPLGATRRR